MLRLDRVFHPVGQGGFYTERFYFKEENIFNVVYDCGSLAGSNKPIAPKFARNIVEKEFKQGERINILFISHFDLDHVNMIKDLQAEIDNVVMPLMSDEKLNSLILLNESLLGDNEKIIRKIANGTYDKIEKSKKIWVRQTSNIEREDDSYRLIGESENSVIVDSGVNILNEIDNSEFKIADIWSYVPYNFKFKQRNQELKIDYLQNLIQADIKKLSNADLQKIRRDYAACKGTINENSMCVYSGFNIENSLLLNHIYSSLYSSKPYVIKEEIGLNLNQPRRILCGALYTGDANLNNTDLDEKLPHYLEHVGVFQVPHHGAENNFDLDRIIKLKNQNVICPISYGTKNSYGHPSAHVLIKLMENGFSPLPITEKPQTKTIISIFLDW